MKNMSIMEKIVLFGVGFILLMAGLILSLPGVVKSFKCDAKTTGTVVDMNQPYTFVLDQYYGLEPMNLFGLFLVAFSVLFVIGAILKANK